MPNGTALENFYFRASYAQKVINDACRFKFVSITTLKSFVALYVTVSDILGLVESKSEI